MLIFLCATCTKNRSEKRKSLVLQSYSGYDNLYLSEGTIINNKTRKEIKK